MGRASVNENLIGKRGESMFQTLIMEFGDRQEPFFNPFFFGDTFPTLDHYVELMGAAARYYFFVQVKSTSKGYKQVHGERRLKVSVTKKDVDRLVAFPAPTYVVGIDEQKWLGFILSVNQPRKGIPDFPTRFPLNRKNLQLLWDEVMTFWESRDMILRNSHFME